MYSFTDDSPIFMQLSKKLRDDIFLGLYPEDTPLPSTTELSVTLHLNPATVLKAVNLLTDEDLVEKRRGIGMFVKKGAREKITEERRKSFEKDYVLPLLREAEKLSLTTDDITEMIGKGKTDET